MEGFDWINVLPSLSQISVDAKRYFMKSVFHLIYLLFINAWVLYQPHCSQLQVQKKNIMWLVTFCINIATVLSISSSSSPIIKRRRSSLESKSNENTSATTARIAPLSALLQISDLIIMIISLLQDLKVVVEIILEMATQEYHVRNVEFVYSWTVKLTVLLIIVTNVSFLKVGTHSTLLGVWLFLDLISFHTI